MKHQQLRKPGWKTPFRRKFQSKRFSKHWLNAVRLNNYQLVAQSCEGLYQSDCYVGFMDVSADWAYEYGGNASATFHRPAYAEGDGSLSAGISVFSDSEITTIADKLVFDVTYGGYWTSDVWYTLANTEFDGGWGLENQLLGESTLLVFYDTNLQLTCCFSDESTGVSRQIDNLSLELNSNATSNQVAVSVTAQKSFVTEEWTTSIYCSAGVLLTFWDDDGCASS